MNLVAIVDYGMCNLDSISRAVEECGGTTRVTDRESDLKQANRIILPGVGAFPDAMANIRKRSLDVILQEHVIHKQIPFLGICLGMQLMAAKGTEGGETEGLGWIQGDVQRLKASREETRVPHIGWNEVVFERHSPLFRGIESGRDFYFVHSYHVCPTSATEILAHTPYGHGFVSAVQRESIFGVQFHPEKSQRIGFQLLTNFLDF